MQGLHLSINDVKLIDLKNAIFMYSNGYRTPWENDDNTRWAYNSSNTLSFFPNLQHEISPSNFLNSLKKKYILRKKLPVGGTYITDSVTHPLVFSEWNSTTSHGRISRFPGHSGAWPQWGDAEVLSFPQNKSNKNTVLLISITSSSLCCFFSDFFFSILYMRHWQTM